MILFLFYLFSAVAILSALAVVFHPQPTRALLSLIVTMGALAVIFVLLGAAFFAMAHLIVYAGAVLVLFLFVIMLQGVGATDVPLRNRFKSKHILVSGVAAAGFLIFIPLLAKSSALAEPKNIVGNIEIFAQSLFSQFLLPFEITSLLLLIGVFAAVRLAKKEPVE